MFLPNAYSLQPKAEYLIEKINFIVLPICNVALTFRLWIPSNNQHTIYE